MEAERLLVLGAGAGQLGLLAAARERGLFVIAVDRDPGASGFRYADRRAILSVDAEPALERLADAERVDGVIAPGSDHSVGVAARIAARHGLPHPVSPDAAAVSTSKVRQRERLLAAGVPQARWRLVSGPGDPELALPCIVESADRQGRRALTVVRSREELEPAVRAAVRASRSGRCLVEELVDGPEVAVNAFSLGGVFRPLTVTDRLPFGDGLAHVWPSQWGQSLGLVMALAERAARALGFDEGPTCTRLRIGPDGPRVICAAARVGATHEATLCEAAVGVDLNGLALTAALGEEIRPERLKLRSRVGGACVIVTPSDAVLATGDTRAQALGRAARAAEYVRFGTGDAEALA